MKKIILLIGFLLTCLSPQILANTDYGEISKKSNLKISEKLETSKQATKLNINTVDAKTLEKIPGIGKAKAAAIIKYRNKVGKIVNLDDLKKVKGIGKSTIKKLKQKFTL